MDYATNCIRKLQITYDETKPRVVRLNDTTYLNIFGMNKLADNLLFSLIDQLNSIKFNKGAKIEQDMMNKYNYYVNNTDVLFSVTKHFIDNSKPKNIMQTYQALLLFFGCSGMSLDNIVSYAIVLHYIKQHAVRSEDIGTTFRNKINEYLVHISDDASIDIEKIKGHIVSIVPDIFDLC